MLIQTRPYNTTNMFDELNGQINKQQIQHTLDTLTTESKIISKEYNNTKLYMINQSTLEHVSQDQINTVDNNIKYYKDKLNTLTLQYQQKQNELTQLTHEYTDEQIDALITQMKEKKQILLNKVSQMTVTQVDRAFSRKPDKSDTYNGMQVYHYEVTDVFRIHVVIESGYYKIIRLDPKHKVHKCYFMILGM